MFSLIDNKQKQINYLINITKLFYYFIYLLSKLKEPTISFIYLIYNLMFNSLDKYLYKLKTKKKDSQKIQTNLLYNRYIATKKKLTKYYKMLYSNLSSLYTLSTLLTPILKDSNILIDILIKDIQKNQIN